MRPAKGMADRMFAMERSKRRSGFVRAFVLASRGEGAPWRDCVAEAYATWDEIEQREKILRGEFVPKTNARQDPRVDFPEEEGQSHAGACKNPGGSCDKWCGPGETCIYPSTR